MEQINRVIVAGNLTRDPELSYTPGGTAVCKFGVACNGWTPTGERPDFFEVVVFGKKAELQKEYKREGDPVMIDGRMKQERWETRSGEKRSRIVIEVGKRGDVSWLPGSGGGHGDDERDFDYSDDDVPPDAMPDFGGAPLPDEAAAPAGGADDDIPF